MSVSGGRGSALGDQAIPQRQHGSCQRMIGTPQAAHKRVRRRSVCMSAAFPGTGRGCGVRGAVGGGRRFRRWEEAVREVAARLAPAALRAKGFAEAVKSLRGL